ncbi:hypothetical protein HMPREF9706_00660 [Facklamia hominis CCUG 36813]|uniref:Transmembrane Fragile-X-F protein n=1 Tax=Facklamia hominis CCUG 36813 TaxID=883111 RepID=K1LCV9_9LACT|nr:hypothetical protein [Facklamia hominis]EKB54470.1 hypothetical protein HMPREF9706_00660 [Facklamia hominis CCUG 36813]
MKNEKNNSRIGFMELLCLLFIALKLMGFIDWSWLWVLSPIWISMTLMAVIAVIIVLVEKYSDM